MTRHWLSVAAIVGMILGAAVGPAGAVSIDFAPGTQTAPVGGSVGIAVTISGLGAGAAPSLGTFDLGVSFDPTILGFVGAVFGDPLLGDQLDLFGLGSITVLSAGSGVIGLFELSLDPAADLDALQAGAFTLATLSFGALAAGVSPLALTVNALGDAAGNALATSVGAGSVTVEGAAVPQPSSLGLVAAGLGGLAALGWRRARRRRACRLLDAEVPAT